MDKRNHGKKEKYAGCFNRQIRLVFLRLKQMISQADTAYDRHE